MRAMVMVSGLLALAACGGGGTTGTNYSEAPPVAEIVATPSPRPTDTPTPESAAPQVDAEANATGNAL